MTGVQTCALPIWGKWNKVKRDANGITFDTYDIQSIADALEYFHHHDLKTMGQASIELEKPFNTENCAQREYDAIIRSLDKKTGK